MATERLWPPERSASKRASATPKQPQLYSAADLATGVRDGEVVGAKLGDPDAQRLSLSLQRLGTAAQPVQRHVHLASSVRDGEVAGAELGQTDAQHLLVRLQRLLTEP